jgi:hypothetical protein
MQRQIVEHDHIAGTQRRYEDLLDVGEEHGIVERAVEDGGRRQAVRGERRDDRVELPLAARREVPQANPDRTAPIPTQQIRRDAAFIEEDVAAGVPKRLADLPAAARRRDIRTPLFGGVYRFF